MDTSIADAQYPHKSRLTCTVAPSLYKATQHNQLITQMVALTRRADHHYDPVQASKCGVVDIVVHIPNSMTAIALLILERLLARSHPLWVVFVSRQIVVA